MGIEALTLAIDRRYPTGDKKRSSVLTILRGGLEQIFQRQPLCGEAAAGTHVRITWQTRDRLRGPQGDETTLLIDARGFAPEGEDCDATLAVKAYHLGWRHLIHYNTRGTRFHGVGFGPRTDGLRIDCYDNPGDYLGSGMDGLEIYVHGNAQDQLCQISKRGKLVVYGDVGQTFLYGAKGGEIYVLGNAAGRPMINAVGSPRVVINGTALDFLAESFMAGDPHNGGGFAIVNGLRYDQQRQAGPAGLAVSGQQPAFAGLGRGDLRPRSASHAGRRATQRRGLPAAVRGRLETDPALPGREPAAVRHPHRAAICSRSTACCGRRPRCIAR